MDTVLRVDSTLHAELTADIQKEINVDMSREKTKQKKVEKDGGIIKVICILENVFLPVFFSLLTIMTTREFHILFHSVFFRDPDRPPNGLRPGWPTLFRTRKLSEIRENFDGHWPAWSYNFQLPFLVIY